MAPKSRSDEVDVEIDIRLTNNVFHINDSASTPSDQRVFGRNPIWNTVIQSEVMLEDKIELTSNVVILF